MLGLGCLTKSVSFFPWLSGDAQLLYWVGASICSVLGCELAPVPGRGHGALPAADGDPPALQGMPAASPVPSWAMPPTKATVTAPSVSAACRPSPPCLSAGSRAHLVWPSLQVTAPPAALRAPWTAWARQKSPTATWVSPGAVVRRLARLQPCRASVPGQHRAAPTVLCCWQHPGSAPSISQEGFLGASPSVQARSGVSIGAASQRGGHAPGNPPGARPRSCSDNSGFPLKGRSSSSGARPPPR